MEYKVIEAEDQYGLENAVKRSIKEGWFPQGGMCVSEGIYYFQAMVREEKE
jgi:hypothetical protein